MPLASDIRRAPFTLLESGRVTSRRHQLAFGGSVIAQMVLVSAAAVELSRVVAPRASPLPDRPTFLAPFIQARPRPIQESVSYLALGGAEAPRPQPASGDTRTATVESDRSIAKKVGGGDDRPPSAAQDADVLPVFSEVEVDSAALRDPDSEAPVYPPTLMAKGIEGSVLATFIVDTSGRPDVGTFIALESTHELFATAVRLALPGMKFRPAKRNNVVVRQQVEQRFVFRVIKPPVAATKPPAIPAA